MKKRTLRTSVGIVAVAALVGMNLLHAWNNYGIKDSSMLLSVKATPAEDSTEVKCDTKPGYNKVVINASESPITNVEVRCIITEVTRYYIIDGDGNKVLIGEEETNYKTGGKPKPLYIKKGYTEDDFKSCPIKETGEITDETFKPKGVKCDGFQQNNCCYPKDPITDCTLLLRGTN